MLTPHVDPSFPAYLVNLLPLSRAQTKGIVFNSASLGFLSWKTAGSKTWELQEITAGIPNTWLRGRPSSAVGSQQK